MGLNKIFLIHVKTFYVTLCKYEKMQRFIIPLKNITILKTLILFLLVCLNSCSRKDLNNPVDQKLINRKETIEKFLKAPSNSSIGLKLLINDIKKTEEKYQFLYEFAKRNGIPNWNAVESNYSNTNLNINEVNQIRSNSIESTNGGTGEIYFIPLIDSISNEVSSYIYCTKDRNGFYKYKTYNKKAILLSTAKDSSDVKKKGMLLSVFAHFERKIYKKNILNFSYPYNYEFNNVNLEFPASELNYSNNLKSASTDSKYKSNSSGCPDHFDIKILIGNSIVPAGSIFRFYINCDGKIITWHVIWPHFPIGGSPTNPPTVPIQNPPPNSNPNPPNLVLNNPPLFVPYFPYTPNPNTINVGGSSGSSPNGNQGSSLPPNWIEDPNDPWMPQNPVIDEIDMPNYSNSPLVFDPNDPWKDIADIIYSPDIPIIENGTYIEDVNDDSAEYQIPGLRKIGSTPPRNNSEDTTHGTNGNTDGIIPFFQTMTDDELFDEMKNLFHITTFFSPYTLRKTGEKMIQKFKNGPKQPPFSAKA